ncbi:hypothetical protein MYX84_08305 [Acidobacteria bacterium AH-259-O06]|nr:hypothetical protein [Acidobacteria bacterium AH-259-O06]
MEQKIVQTYEDQNNAIEKIRDTLAKSRNLRKRDFDQLMKPIVDLQNHRKEQIHKLLKDFCREEEENIFELKKILVGKNNSTMDDFYVLKEKILSRPKAREAELSELLKSFHQDQAELDAVLRRLLAKGTNIQVKDLKRAIRAFQADHYADAVVVDDILKEFSQIKQDIDHQWEAVVNTVGLRKYVTRTTDD